MRSVFEKADDGSLPPGKRLKDKHGVLPKSTLKNESIVHQSSFYEQFAVVVYDPTSLRLWLYCPAAILAIGSAKLRKLFNIPVWSTSKLDIAGFTYWVKTFLLRWILLHNLQCLFFAADGERVMSSKAS